LKICGKIGQNMIRTILLLALGLFLTAIITLTGYRFFQNRVLRTTTPSSEVSEPKGSLPERLADLLPFQKATPTPTPTPTPSVLGKARDNENFVLADLIRQALAEKHLRTPEEITVLVSNRTESHAIGLSGFTAGPGGGWWLAFKTKGGWDLVAEGDKDIICEEINPYNFPAEIVPECYSRTTQKMIKR
jgi:hypothetical protein